MIVNTKEYIAKMQKHQQTILDRASLVVNATVVEMFEKIVDRTPVGDPSLWNYPAPKGYNPGTLKASWVLDYNTNGAMRNEKGQFATQAKYGISLKLGSRATQDAIIYNQQPYASRVEYGSWSTQAPSGMMRITVKEYDAILNKNATRYRIK